MEKKRKTYDIDFKKKVVDLHLEEGMGYNLIAKELGIDKNQVRRWVNHFNNEGMMGLEEKRGSLKESVWADLELFQKIQKLK